MTPATRAAAACLISGLLLTPFTATAPAAPATGPATKPATGTQAIEQRIDHAVKVLDTPGRDKGAAELKAILRELEADLAKQPKDAARHFLAGKVHFYLEADAKAAAAYDRAIALAPDEPEYRYMKGVLLRFQEKPDEAIRELTAAARLGPKQAKYWFELGTALAASDRRREALDAFRKATEADPKHAKSLMMTGTLVLEEGKTDEAIALLKQAAAADPGYVMAHYNLGQLYQNQGKADESLKAFQAAAKLAPDDERIRAKVIQNLQALGRTKERDAERAALFDLHKAGKVQAPFYCREQFTAGKEKVMVFEYFELKGDRALRYSFNVLDDKGEKPKYKLSLGSYDMTTEIARSVGEIGKDERMFHLDAYYPDGEHRTYGMYKKEPTYEQTRETVVAVIEGKLKPQSGMKPGKE